MRFALVLVLPVLLHAAEPGVHGVDRIFAAFDKPGSPGCALGVIRDGNFVYRRGYGEGSLELATRLSSQSVFYMGSVSKQFTAASAVLASEQGLLSLDDSVRKYIPELPAYTQPVTLRQMLHHTSGFRDILSLLDISGRSALDLHPKQEWIEMIARQKALNYKPGDEYLYSNTNYFLLAEAVSRASGKPFAVFAADNIFRPLGMTHTRFYDDRTAVVPGRVAAYSPAPGGGFLVDWSTNFEGVGAGGLMSSVDDLLLWDRNFYRNTLGRGTLLKQMHTRGVLNDGTQIPYALGIEIGEYRGLPIVEHGGALFGYRTEILRFPEQRFTVLCLCNLSTAGPGDLARKVADLYLEGKLGAAAKAPQRGSSAVPLRAATIDPTPYAGDYKSNELDATYRLSVEQGILILRVGWNRPVKLIPVKTDEFESDALGTLVFQRGSDNRIAGLSVSAGRIRNVMFEKTSATAP